MPNKKLMALAIFLVGLLAVSAASAADNITSDIASADMTTNEFVSIEEQTILKENESSQGTFTDLANEIANATDELTLTRDYAYCDEDPATLIKIDKSIIINGNGHTINGNNKIGAFEISGSDAILKNIEFVNIRGNGCILWTGATGTVTDCSFTNTYSWNGGTIYWTGGTGTIANCSFTNTSGWEGGAIYLNFNEDETFTIANCSFTNTHSEYSGAIEIIGVYVYPDDEGEYYPDISSFPKVSITDCSFTNTTAAKKDGGIYIEGAIAKIDNCNFTDSISISGGSAIDMSCYNGEITNCIFTNTVKTINHPMVYWSYSYYKTKAIVSNCTFIKPSNDLDDHFNYGGGIYFSIDDAMLTNCSFINCAAGNGGAVYSSYYENCTISDCNFTNCIAKKHGGAIYYAQGPVLNCNFINCSSGYEDTIIYKTGGIETRITAPTNFTTTYNSDEKLVATLKVSGKPLQNANVTFVILDGPYPGVSILENSKKTLTTNSKGEVSYSTDGIAPGNYTVAITFPGDETYAASYYEDIPINIKKANTVLSAKYNGTEKYLLATLKDADGKAIEGVKIGFVMPDGVKYAQTDANGQAKYSVKDLADGSYSVQVAFLGDANYNPSNKETVKFAIGNKEQSKIYLRNALYFALQTKYVTITLWDGNNNPIANKTVHIQLNNDTWKYSGVTDEKGNAVIRVGVGFGVHNATVSFDGDDQYNASEKTGYVRVIKETPSVMVRGADSQFKASDNPKTVKVYLWDRYSKPLPVGSKIFLRINGQQYVGLTDSQGIAHVEISLNRPGTYEAQAIYMGNSAYNPVTRNIKIYIK